MKDYKGDEIKRSWGIAVAGVFIIIIAVVVGNWVLR